MNPHDAQGVVRGTLTMQGSDTPLTKRWREVCSAADRCATTGEPVARFDARAYEPAAVAMARSMWRMRMVSEHRSTTVFAAMAIQLMEAGAPADTTGLALAMAQDELRHAALCADVLVALGGEARVDDATLTSASLPTHPGCTREEAVLRNVIYGSCLSELVNAARFVEALERITDPFVRDATRRLLADEVLHAQFGFHCLTAFGPWLATRPEVRASLGAYLRQAFGALEDAMVTPGSFTVPSSDAAALGVPDAACMRDVFFQTIEHAAVPGLERHGIEAGVAWRTRHARKTG